MKGGCLYFMTNRRDGILYAGVTSNLPSRAFQHREGVIKGFTKRYGLKRLVYYEYFDDIRDAIQREKTIKHWPRAWKVRLIHSMNPDWDDLYDTLIRSSWHSEQAILSVAPAPVAGIHVFLLRLRQARRGWPGQARP
jgi:putative endonuclease